jgi:ABC-2 type transport system permease protein
MNALTLVRAHVTMTFLDLVRWPGYVVPTVVFPAMFFVFFDLSFARESSANAAFLTLAFIVFAVVGVTFYQFGVNIALDRGRPWERYLRTLPATAIERFTARIVTAMIFALATAAVVALVAVAFTPIHLSLVQWLLVLLYCIAGGVPFVFIGITIGYWASAPAAMPIATATNLLLAYAGGLWIPPKLLPPFVQAISPYLPTREFANLVWSITGRGSAAPALLGLATYTVVFAVTAVLVYRRDERTRYA